MVVNLERQKYVLMEKFTQGVSREVLLLKREMCFTPYLKCDQGIT